MHRKLEIERDLFAQRKRHREILARRTAISLRALGIDFQDAGRLAGIDRARLVCRLDRLIERERLRGANGHWSYDLNRHIALKQLRDGLAGST